MILYLMIGHSACTITDLDVHARRTLDHGQRCPPTPHGPATWPRASWPRPPQGHATRTHAVAMATAGPRHRPRPQGHPWPCGAAPIQPYPQHGPQGQCPYEGRLRGWPIYRPCGHRTCGSCWPAQGMQNALILKPQNRQMPNVRNTGHGHVGDDHGPLSAERKPDMSD